MGIKLLAALVAATLALTGFAPVAGATTAPKPQTMVFTGHTADGNYVYAFTAPRDRDFAVSWTSSPYPTGEHGEIFDLGVGAYADPISIPCDAPKMWCSSWNANTEFSSPAAGDHTFFSGAGGHFAVGVAATKSQWVIKVIIGAVQPPGPPGIGSTINIPSSAGSGTYAVQLVQVYNNYVWTNPSGDEVGTRPVTVKLKVSDTGTQTLTVVGESQVLLTSDGTTYQPDLVVQSPPGCPQQTAFGTLIPGTSEYVCVTFDFPTHIGLAGSKVWWTQFGATGAPLYYWVLPAM